MRKEELWYRKLTIEDIEDMTKIWSDSRVIKYTNILKLCNVDEIRARIEILKQFDTFAIMKDRHLIGVIGCPYINKDKKHYGLFYQLRYSEWANGYATMAVEWMLSYMEKKYTSAIIYADVITENLASVKILKKAGFKFLSQEEKYHNGELVVIQNYVYRK